MSKKYLPAKLNYTQLIKILKDEIATSENRVQLTIENEKNILYWRMGKYIYEHLLEYQKRAERGNQLFAKLSEDLGIAKRILNNIVQFYREFPNEPARAHITWTHYRLLLTVKDENQREKLLTKVQKEKLSTRDLEKIIQKYQQQNNLQIETSVPTTVLQTRGIPYLYKIKSITLGPKSKSELILDLGFYARPDHNIVNINQFKEGDIVSYRQKGNNIELIKSDYTFKEIHTYKAILNYVVDGDTLSLEFDLGFNTRVRQKVRFHRIDSESIDTEQGKKASAYVKKAVHSVPFVVVKTHGDDVHGRWLGEVFYLPGEKDVFKVAAEGRFLNQELVDAGLAKVVEPMW